MAKLRNYNWASESIIPEKTRAILRVCGYVQLWGINTLQWRHKGRDGVSNHQPRECLLNRTTTSKKTSKLRVSDLCEGNSPVIGEFPAQRASNAENVPIRWRHHGYVCYWVNHIQFINLNIRTIFKLAITWMFLNVLAANRCHLSFATVKLTQWDRVTYICHH